MVAASFCLLAYETPSKFLMIIKHFRDCFWKGYYKQGSPKTEEENACDQMEDRKTNYALYI